MDKARMKSYMLLILFTAALLAVVVNFEGALALLSVLGNELKPVIMACVIAFIINVPMTAIGKRIHGAFDGKKPLSHTLVGSISLVLTFVILALVLWLMVTMIVPQLVQSGRSIYELVKEKVPEFLAYLKSLNLDTTAIEEYLSQVDLNSVLEKFTSNAGNVVSLVVGTASSTIGAVITFLIALIISFYIVLNKHTLTHQAKAIAYANLSKEQADKLCYISALTSSTYSKFLSGQCIEAVILSVLLGISLSIAKIPYASVIACTTAVMSFVPYVGAFFSCAMGVLLVLMVDPFKALVCFIVFMCVQFVEGHFIYPQVVGTSVGLPSMWTLIAVLVGGKLFGLLGMLFFIPLLAVLYTLITEDTHKKLKEKEITLTEE